MNRWSKAGIFSVLLLLASCARVQLQEVQIPPERIVQKGYSLVPLNEKGWYIAGRNPYQLAIAKLGENREESFAIQGVLVKLSAFTTNEEFVRLVKEGQANDTDPKRLRMIRHDVTAYPPKGPNCAMSYGIMEDNAAVKRSGQKGNMLLEMMTLSCAHPKDKSIAINVAYSHRYLPGQNDDRFLEKASSVLSSVEFGDMGKLDSD